MRDDEIKLVRLSIEDSEDDAEFGLRRLLDIIFGDVTLRLEKLWLESVLDATKDDKLKLETLLLELGADDFRLELPGFVLEGAKYDAWPEIDGSLVKDIDTELGFLTARRCCIGAQGRIAWCRNRRCWA